MELFPYCWIQSGSPLLPWWLSDKESACSIGDEFWSLGRKDPRKKEMATHSSILFFFFTPVFLTGESPWTEELGGLQSMGSQELDTT